MPGRVDVRTPDVELAAKMAEGSLGALNACKELLGSYDCSNPQAFKYGGWMTMYYLDALGIYGERLYFLWNNICHRNIPLLKAIVFAWKLGGVEGVTQQTINYAIDVDWSVLNLNAIRSAVHRQMPELRQISSPQSNMGFCLN